MSGYGQSSDFSRVILDGDFAVDDVNLKRIASQKHQQSELSFGRNVDVNSFGFGGSVDRRRRIGFAALHLAMQLSTLLLIQDFAS